MEKKKFKLREKLEMWGIFTKHKKDTTDFQRIVFKMEGKLQSGETVYFDVLEVGQPIMLINPTSGQMEPLKDGSYTLEDGTAFTVATQDMEGMPMSVITELTMPAEGEEAAPTGDAAQPNLAEAGASDAKAKTVIESIIKESRFSVDETLSVEDQTQAVIEHIKILNTKVTEKETEVEKFKKDVEDRDKVLAETQEILKELDKTEAAAVTHKVSKFRKHFVPDAEARTSAIAKLLNKKK